MQAVRHFANSSPPIDPRLTIRHTLVYGALATLATVVFALCEDLASGYLAGLLALPERAAPWIATAVLALVVGPLQRRIAEVVRRILRLEWNLFGLLVPAYPPTAVAVEQSQNLTFARSRDAFEGEAGQPKAKESEPCRSFITGLDFGGRALAVSEPS